MAQGAATLRLCQEEGAGQALWGAKEYVARDPGDFMDQPPGQAQVEATRTLLANLQYALGWFMPILGHREIALAGFATSCPGDTFLTGPRWKDLVAGARLGTTSEEKGG